MKAFWLRQAGLALSALIAGALFGPGAGLLALAAGLALALVLLLRDVTRLEAWLARADAPRPAPAVDPHGPLGRIALQLRARQLDQRRTENDLAQIMEATRSLPDSVVILDTEARIVWLNDTAGPQLGLARGRDEGHFIHYLLRQQPFVQWLNGAEPGTAFSMTSPVRPDLRLALRKVPMPHAQRMLIAQDVTDIERVEVMRRDFVANVSHELRTPITVLAGYLEAYHDMLDPEPAAFRQHMAVMQEQTARMRRLLDDLLALARLEGDPAVQDDRVDMCELAARLVDDARTLSQGRHTIGLACETDACLRGSAQELHSALGNLVVNAVRYTPDGGRIDVAWRASGHGGAEFVVTDTGEGIEAKHISRLTERFYRVDRGRSRATGGTGLGLAIVKHVLQRHQGHLRIDSTLGKGSRFTALFPAERVMPASAAARRAPDGP